MRFTLSASAVLAIVASSLALQVTAPEEGSSLDLSKDNKISWSSVGSDPTSFNIFLTNNNVNPPVRMEIAMDVETSSGSYDISPVSDVAVGENYRIGLESPSQGILAQSGQFNVSGAGSSSISSTCFPPSTSAMTSRTFAITLTFPMYSDLHYALASTDTPTANSTNTATATPTSSASSGPTSSGAASSLNSFAGASVLAMIVASFL